MTPTSGPCPPGISIVIGKERTTQKKEQKKREENRKRKKTVSEKTLPSRHDMNLLILLSTSSSGVMSHRQICPSWQPVMMVLKSSITSTVLMQCVGAVRPHSTMGKTRPFPDIVVIIMYLEEEN